MLDLKVYVTSVAEVVYHIVALIAIMLLLSSHVPVLVLTAIVWALSLPFTVWLTIKRINNRLQPQPKNEDTEGALN